MVLLNYGPFWYSRQLEGFQSHRLVLVPLELHPTISDRTAGLHRCFVTAKPFRYVVIDEFLNPELCRQLMQEFPAFDSARAINERGETGRKAVVSEPARLGPAYSRFDQMIRGHEFLELISRIAGIPKLLYDPEYVGGGTHENLDGQDL